MKNKSAKKKKLLILTNEPPFPVKTGYGEYISGQIKILSNIFDIYILSLADSKDKTYRCGSITNRGGVKKIWIFPHNIRIGSSPKLILKYLFSLISPWSYVLVRDFNQNYRRFMHQLFDRYHFDCLLVNPLSLAPNLSAKLLKDRSCLKVVDVDLLRSRYFFSLAEITKNPLLKFLYRFESRKQFFWERRLLSKFDRIIYLDSSYRHYLSSRLGLQNRKLFKGFSYFSATRLRFRESNRVSLLFLGNLLWKPNRDGLLLFLDNIWPEILKKLPKAKLCTVGMLDDKTKQALSSFPSLEITGYVKNLNPIIVRSRLLISPVITSGGVRIKILKALSSGLPVVCTPESLAGHPDMKPYCLIYRNPSQCASMVSELVNDKNKAKKYSLSGLQYIKQRYGRPASLTQAKKIFRV